ncbi:MAG TPA: NlpC/P60 family protein [Terriglobales bacterium]
MLSARVRTSPVVVSLLSACLYVPIAAQTVQAIPNDRVRLASREEGEAVVEAAWELRRGLGSKPDCSHFVNAIYAQAGLDFEYSSSSDIFDGINSFRRVHRPQPGDLVVWRGHVGIVVDPNEHSFYSSVLSGFAIEDYLSDYWVSRGPPRFYRYLIDDVHSARLAGHSNSNETVLAPAPLTSARPVLRRPSAKAGRDLNRQIHDGSTILEPSDEDAEISDIMYVSSHARPSNADVEKALLRLADANGEHLPGHAVLRPNQTMVVAELVTVTEITIHDHSGWAQLKVSSRGSIRTAESEANPNGAEQWSVVLRRNEGRWVLQAPQNHLYLRRDLAVRVQAEHVAVMSRESAHNPDIKKAVKALDDLLSLEIPGQSAGLR